MGRRGPKAQPETVKAQKAPVRSRREARAKPAAAAAAAADRAKAPAWLAGRGLEIWSRLSPHLVNAKLLGPADEAAFGRYCRNLATWLDLRDALDTDGYTYEAESYAAGKDGDAAKTSVLRRADPRFQISDRLERQLLAAEDRFGMNPSERQRIMAARLNTGVSGDLFDSRRDEADPATRPAAAAEPLDSPVGMLN